MENNSKKLMIFVLICIMFSVPSFVPILGQEATVNNVAINSNPLVSIEEVNSTSFSEIKVSVEISLAGYNYDYYVETLMLFLNQSEEHIIETDYQANATKTFGRQDEETFEATILSPRLDQEPFEDSAYYNITVLVETNTEIKSELVQWDGGYYYIDNDEPAISFITPAEYRERVFGTYEIKVNITDNSNLKEITFIIDETVQHRIKNPKTNQTIFTWDWYTENYTRGAHFVKIIATDDTPRSNQHLESETVRVVGPELTWVEERPTYVDSNDTLYLNVSLIDDSYDIDKVLFNYSINDNPWQSEPFNATSVEGQYNFTLPQQPLGTKITWEIFANNTEGEYQRFRNETNQPYVIYSVYPDHIKPKADLSFKKHPLVNEPVIIEIEVIEQSSVNACLLNYQINFEKWQETPMTNTTTGNETYSFQYEFEQDFEAYDQIRFYIRVNDSGGNELLLNNKGLYYSIKIYPIDNSSPNITINDMPEEIINGQSITISVTIEDESTIYSVSVYYTVGLKQYIVELNNTEGNIWSATFEVQGATGESVELWIRAMDEYYNTIDSEVTQFEIKSQKTGIRHANVWLVFLLILIIIIPVGITIYMLKPRTEL
ncbi:MAG: hypothetical protein GF308_09065 [Candidatus Heimdallarchaeota archaeon]|nr:hypothetical protein [Candidatus Heimdallarchaeota archaeon]